MAKTLKVFGWIFLVLGILGFFSNPIVGSSTSAWFHTDLNHNILVLLSGLIMLWVAYKARAKAGVTLKTFGWIYLVVAILGFFLVSGTGTLLGLIEINGADSWLHLVLAAALLWVSMKNGKKSISSMEAGSMPTPSAEEPIGSTDSREQGGGNNV